MKKLNLKSILGTAIVLSALANARAEIPKKVKKSKTTSAVVFKYKIEPTIKIQFQMVVKQKKHQNRVLFENN